MANPHTQLVNAIQKHYNDAEWIRLWPANVVAGKMKSGNYVTAGIKGQADLTGVLAPTGQRLEVEVKTGTGRQRKDQVAWQRMIESMGGIYIVARSVEDVEKAINHGNSRYAKVKRALQGLQKLEKAEVARRKSVGRGDLLTQVPE